MLFDIQFSWPLVLFDLLIYALLQVSRMCLDMILPQQWFDPNKPYYHSWSWEQNGAFYQRHFHIRTWKDKLPSVNSLDHFSKKNLGQLSPNYLRQFIFQTCRGESHHVRSILTTAVFLMWNPTGLFLLIFLLSTLGNLPFIFIQRYNRPRLRAILTQIEGQPGEGVSAS